MVPEVVVTDIQSPFTNASNWSLKSVIL